MRKSFTKIAVCASVFAASVFSIHGSYGQEFLWKLRFDTKFDNREYAPISTFAKSQTYFSVRVSPVVGIGFAGDHSVMVGGDFTFDMGAPLSKRNPELVLYYNFDSKKYKAVAGIFPRSKLIGGYSRAMFSGSQTFYDNNLEGFALQYTPRRGHLELVLDWDSMQSADRREGFRILSSGGINAGVFTAGYALDVYHLASSADALEGVVDHIMVYPWAGAAFDRIAPWFERLSLTVGWIHSFDRERRGENVWKTPHGGMIEFRVQKWGVGIRNQLYLGGSQMPFRDEEYGKQIYRGDPLFRTDSGLYNFMQVYWRPKFIKWVDLDFHVGLHHDGYKMGWQQVAWVTVSLDNTLFGSKKKDRGR